MSQSSQAYKLFSDGKPPIDVAIALNLREAEVAQYYRVLEAKAAIRSQSGL
jgi:hypothetical protein